MTTFSQLVDRMVSETKRPDLRAEIVGYLNQTIRELHFEPSRGNVTFYNDNYREESLTVDAADRFSWQVPNPGLFQGMAAVRFDSMFDRSGKRIYAQPLTPGPRMEQTDYFYYRAGGTFVFGGLIGYGAIGSTISIAYYEYPPTLKYYALVNRPASYDPVTGWTYSNTYDDNDDLKEQARILTSNWILMRWEAVLEEGLRAKIYKRLSDDIRQRTSYSLYMQLRQGLFTSEVADVGIYS